MTFQSEFMGNERDRSGIATFTIGETKVKLFFEEFTDFHAINGLLNKARQFGREEAASQVAARLTQFVREIKG